VTQPKHAAAFCNGMEYFNTYGGCTAAGAAGMATLRVIQEEGFQAHALRVGRYLTAKLNALKQVRLVACALCGHSPSGAHFCVSSFESLSGEKIRLPAEVTPQYQHTRGGNAIAQGVHAGSLRGVNTLHM
jgi:ethanolamine-phosphate phospho-lyase